jgi:D-beta-D-heptose 7-phosphate kinase/D-beta-D-heptose 1-phosphate adenosyltransferase
VRRVVVNGTFDIVHLGHINLLNTAKEMGDYLLVAIDSDRRVIELKGSGRPINNELERKTLLENLKAVDQVEIFDSKEELIEILKAYNADIMVKGSDYKGKSITGHAYCKEVVYFNRIDEYSTTKKIQDIINR